MDNLTLNQARNATFGSCGSSIDGIHTLLNTILLFISFPTTFLVIVKLLSRIYKARSFSSAEMFLLQLNFTNVCLFIFNLMLFLEEMRGYGFSENLYMVFYSPTLTARPVFLLALCGILHLAIVHPVTYMTAKTQRHWEWLIITFGWLYAATVVVVLIFCEFDIFSQIYNVVFYNTILPSIFFNVATLKALSSGGPGNRINPAKKKAFRIILSILVVLLLFYIPRVFYLIYMSTAPGDWRFECLEGSMIMFLPKFSEIAGPVIFLYSLTKLSV